ncbi:unnamed protein product [Gulo gulo]|uniref:Uncharacterized protein n=1 Tax=Gulo gulo TaxID=48420 RepID=A0A9X9LLX2_GULGU|nr:unnamed protein product [Gulo gulo]
MPLHCTKESIYREIRRTVGQDNVDLDVVEVSGKPQEPSTDSEPPITSINQPTTSNRQRMNQKKPCQPNIEDIEKLKQIVNRVKLALQQSSRNPKKTRKQKGLVRYRRAYKKANPNKAVQGKKKLDNSASASNVSRRVEPKT